MIIAWPKRPNSTYPPLERFKALVDSYHVYAAPFKTGREGSKDLPVVIDDIKKIYEQNNYTNIMLYSIGKQMDEISGK